MNRLSKVTHSLNNQALSGIWGKKLVDQPIHLSWRDYIFSSQIMQYAKGSIEIALKSPIRILPQELIIGSATLLQAAKHRFPLYKKNRTLCSGVSHTTLDFLRVLSKGLNEINKDILKELSQKKISSEKRELLNGMLICIDAITLWKHRYQLQLKDLIAHSDNDMNQKAHYQKILRNIENIPQNPPKTFYEAVQSLWFSFCFQRLCGNWPGIGRIDQILGQYLDHDLDLGRITMDEAREILAHFWIKGCDWIGANGFENGSGDAQHYQNIVLSGLTNDEKDGTNAVTYLILDIVEELKISEFPITVRISSRTPTLLWQRIADVQSIGGGIVAIYNEDLIITMLESYGYSHEDAINFANDGCWELIIPGKTAFTYIPIDLYQIFQDILGITNRNILQITQFDELYSLFKTKLNEKITQFHLEADQTFNPRQPTVLIDLYESTCIQTGKSYFNRGVPYSVVSPHAGGLIDVGNSLYIIKKVVFEDQLSTLAALISAVKCNWIGKENEILRAQIRSKYPLFGNEMGSAEEMVNNVLSNFIEIVNHTKKRNEIMRPPGISTFGRQIEWASNRGGSVTGALQGEYLSSNCSPSPGTDTEGASAVINSHCALNLNQVVNGTALDLKIDSQLLRSAQGNSVLITLMQIFMEKGGIFLHLDVTDDKILREAQHFPDRYFNLAVRISGWSARFITLGPEWQDMIINRTTHTKE